MQFFSEPAVFTALMNPFARNVREILLKPRIQMLIPSKANSALGDSMPPSVHRLSELQTGQSGWVEAISGGWNFRQSLNQVGIHSGDSFKVERGAHLGGPVLIKINSSQIALGHGMSDKILVRIDEKESI
jgi:ferrous iron transport protein A